MLALSRQCSSQLLPAQSCCHKYNYVRLLHLLTVFGHDTIVELILCVVYVVYRLH